MMNGQNKRLKNAPNLNKIIKQNIHPAQEILILIGDNPWSFYRKNPKDEKTNGQGSGWQLLADNIDGENPNRYKELPVIIDERNYKELDKLALLPNEHRCASLVDTSGLFKVKSNNNGITLRENEELLRNICINLAKYTQVNAFSLRDLLGQHLEDLSAYVERLRDEYSQESEGEPETTENKDKTKPYIEYRENNHIKGLHYVVPKIDKETLEILGEKESWICDDLALIGEGKTKTGEYYYLFQWQNADEKQPRIVAIPYEDFGTETGWKMLKAQGLKMTQGSGLAQKLTEHFHFNGDHSTQWTITKTTGWINGAYLLPNGEIIGQPSKPIYFTDKSGASEGYTTKGTIEQWQKEIAQNLRGNYSMMLGVAVALSAPLLYLISSDSFGVHLFAESSKGKTTILNIANSIYGDPNKIKLSWSATATGVKNEASARNDGLITLDEIGQAKDVRNLESIAYDLFNETGKLQGKKEGGNREINRWKVTAFSTGEKDLETQLALQGAKVHAGQLVRLINIPIVETNHFHNFANAKEHADHLNNSVKEIYGVAGREWIAFLAENKERVKQTFQKIRKKWIDLSEDMNSQVKRVAVDRFAVLETALSLASFITQWSEEENQQAILKNFLSWREEFGEKSREETTLINDFLDWLTLNESYFIEYPADPMARSPSKIMGVKVLGNDTTGEEIYFFVIPKAFKEATANYPKNMALKILTNAGIMQKPHTIEKNYDYQFKVPSKMLGRRIRAYKITPVIDDE